MPTGRSVVHPQSAWPAHLSFHPHSREDGYSQAPQGRRCGANDPYIAGQCPIHRCLLRCYLDAPGWFRQPPLRPAWCPLSGWLGPSPAVSLHDRPVYLSALRAARFLTAERGGRTRIMGMIAGVRPPPGLLLPYQQTSATQRNRANFLAHPRRVGAESSGRTTS